MTWLRRYRFELTVLAVAAIGAFALRQTVFANWELQAVPYGLNEATFYASASTFDVTTRTHIAWAAGQDASGHPLILQNKGKGWVRVYNEANLGTVANPMAVRSLAVLNEPEKTSGGTIQLIAAGDRGLLLYSQNGTGWHLQLQQAAALGQRCTDTSEFASNYFDTSVCVPWSGQQVTLRGTAAFPSTYRSNYTQFTDHFFIVVGDKDAAGHSTFLTASGTSSPKPEYLTWATLSLVANTLDIIGNPNLTAITAQRYGGWLVGQNPGRLIRITREDTGYPSLENVTPPGFPASAPTGVAAIEERDVDGTGKVPAHVWITTDDATIYRYEYPDGALVQDVSGPIDGRTPTTFSGIVAQGDVLGGNLVRNGTFVDDFVASGTTSPRYWSIRSVTRTTKAAEGDASGPTDRLKLTGTLIDATQLLRVDAYTGREPGTRGSTTPSTQGSIAFHDSAALKGYLTSLVGRSNDTSLRVLGFLKVPTDGAYTFRLRHTNGARVYLGDSPVSDLTGAQADFTTPLINAWDAGSARDSDSAPQVLSVSQGWQGTGFYPITVEWWNGDPATDSGVSDNPELVLQWRKGSEPFTDITQYDAANPSAGGLANVGNDASAYARQVVSGPFLLGQTFRIRAQVKATIDDPRLLQLNIRDPRRPVRGLAGFDVQCVDQDAADCGWHVPSLTSAYRSTSDFGSWQTVDLTVTQTSAVTRGLLVECLADFGTTVRCGDIRVEAINRVDGVGEPPAATRYNVWVVGNDGILASRHSTEHTDHTWALEDTGTPDDLFAISTANATHAWAVGDGTLLRYTGGNVKGWGWFGSDSGDSQTTPVSTNDALGWVSFSCANTTTENPSGSCTNSPFNYGVHLNGPPVCYNPTNVGPGTCTNDPTHSCTSDADCAAVGLPQDPNDGAISGRAWFGVTDASQTLNLGLAFARRSGFCVSDSTYEPSSKSFPCSQNSDCPSNQCAFQGDSRASQCSANASFATCGSVDCSTNPLACRPIGWLSFDRSETGNPPAEPYNTGSGPIARFNAATGVIDGWARFLSLVKADGTGGWVRYHDPATTCIGAVCPTSTAPEPYNLCRDCTVSENNPGTSDDAASCRICSSRVTKDFPPPDPSVLPGDQCQLCGSTAAAQTCHGVCQGSLTSCVSDAECAPQRCVGYGTCAISGNTCVTNGDCNTSVAEPCQDVGRTCPNCQQCSRWGSALDNSSGEVVGWAWSEDFGWMDTSNIRVGNVAWLQTQFGDVYTGGNLGSLAQSAAPSGQSNATYLLQAGGKIINFTSSLSTSTTAPPELIYQENVAKIPLAEKDKASILGRFDYSNIIGDTTGDGRPDGFDPSTRYYTAGKYGSVANVSFGTDGTLSEALIFGDSLISIDLRGLVYFFNENKSLGNVTFVNGAQNGAGLFVVNGNLDINGNWFYATNPSTTTDLKDRQLASIGVIVTGDLTISENVTDLVGTFYVLGKVTVKSRQSSQLDSQLRVKGVMVAHEFVFSRQYKGSIDRPEPAELIQFDGRLIANPPPGFQDLSKALPKLRITRP